jgi:hypothetical protein
MADATRFRPGGKRQQAAPTVVITMPAYNAEATLARTVADIPAGIADQLILVDDASPDNTAQLARDLGIQVHVHPENRGYGGNQKTCYSLALRGDADIVVMLHPDYQYEPKAVPLLIAPILAGDADMTFGSRFAGLGDPRAGGMPLSRYVGNRVTTVLENLMLGSRFTEMHSGMRAYTRWCLLSLPFLRYREDFVFDSQFLIDAVTTGQRVVEVPIPTRYTDESSSIGMLRSTSYVGRSLGYCAGRVWSHGRRGHRSPLGRQARGRQRATAVGAEVAGVTESSDDERLVSWALDALKGYFVGGNRLLYAGDDPPAPATEAGWSVVDEAQVGDGRGGLDVLLIRESDPGGRKGKSLQALRAHLAADGIVGVLQARGGAPWATGSAPHQFEQELCADGFQLVEWRRARLRDRRMERRRFRAGVLHDLHVSLAIARPGRAKTAAGS